VLVLQWRSWHEHIYFNRDSHEDNAVNYYNVSDLNEALFSEDNSTHIEQAYEAIDYSDSDLASEEVSLPHNRRAPKHYPEGQWTRSVAKMANVSRENMSKAMN
jgi:hypothetical protein